MRFLVCSWSITIAAKVLNTNAYHNGPMPPNAKPIAIPPNETWAIPSPSKARFLINKKVPRKAATIATTIEAINGR